MEQMKAGKMVQLKFRGMEKPQDGMMEQLKDSIIGLVLKINRWSQTQTPRRSDDDYDDRQNSCYYQQMQGVSLLINTTYLLCSAIKRNLQTQVGLKFLREVLIRQHQSYSHGQKKRHPPKFRVFYKYHFNDHEFSNCFAVGIVQNLICDI